MSLRARLNLGSGRRALVAILVAVLFATELVTTLPAEAGTLTSPTWTVMDPRTNIQGNRYDYGFTTATAGTVNRVTATVPAGTTGSNRYLAVNSNSLYNYASTTDSTNNSITGDLDIRAKAAMNTWTGAGSWQTLIGKWGTSGNQSYILRINAGGIAALYWSTNGSDSPQALSSVAVPFTEGATGWVRATLQVNNGSSGNTVNFYTSTDGTAWTQLGTSIISAGTTSIYDGTYNLQMGAYLSGGQMRGKLYYGDVRSGIGGTTTSPSNCSQAVANCFDPSSDSVGGASWSSADNAAESWVVNRSGTNVPADIASDLSVMNISGLPAGGTAQLREIDSVVNYTLPTATSVSSGTAIKLGVAGMTNTYTAGSPTSTITTLDNTSTTIDSANTNAVNITVPTIATASANATALTTPTAATTVDVMPYGLGVTSSKVLYTDSYADTANYVDTSTSNASRIGGTGFDGAANNATALLSTLSNPAGIVQDSSGNTYIADQNGAQIRKITGTTMSTLVSSGISKVQGMAIDSSDNIYFADMNRHAVYKMTTGGTVTLVAGTPDTAGSTIGANATSSNLAAPTAVAVNSAGTLLYIADTNNARIDQVTIATGAISILAGGGASTADGVSATTATVNPWGLAVDSSGNVYESDYGRNKIREISGGIINTIAGTGTAGFSGDGGAAATATLSGPRQLAIDPSNNIYVVDYTNQRIRKITGTTISTYAGTGKSSWAGDGGPLSQAHFYGPSGEHADNSGNLYIADNKNNAIRKINQYGIVSTVAGLGPFVNTDSGDGSAATAAGLSAPRDVLPDNAGNVYVSESGKIRKISSTGIMSTFETFGVFNLAFSPDYSTLYGTQSCTVLAMNVSNASWTTYAGTGNCSASNGDNGPATSAQIRTSRGLTSDSKGNVYVGDWSSNNVRKIDTSGIITTYLGVNSSSVDGVANRTRAGSNIDFLAADSMNNIYVQFPRQVIEAASTGTATLVAGNGTYTSSGDGGPSTSASLMGVGGIGFQFGNTYISDGNANDIRVIAGHNAVAPLVNNDTMSVPMNVTRTWPILSNDWSRSNEMDPSSVTTVTAPAHGTVTYTVPTNEATTLQANYTPTNGYTGSDSFVYQACDITRVQCASATVSVTVGSNQVYSVAGGVTEGLINNISFQPSSITRYRNYIFIQDGSFNVIRRLDIYSNQVTTFAGNGFPGYTSDGGPANATSIQGGALASAPDGTIYFTDGANWRVRSVSPAGTISTVIGTGSSGNPVAGAAAISSKIYNPSAITLDPSGNVVLALQTQIWSFPVGGVVTLVAGTGTAGATGNNISATTATLTLVSGLAYDGNTLYISDSSVGAVRKIVGGVISTVAGQLGTNATSVDGTAAVSANLNGPKGMFIDSDHTIYIAESGTYKVRLFTDGGNLGTVTVAGSCSWGGIAGGPALGELWITCGGSFYTQHVKAGVATSLGISSSSLYSGDGISGVNAQLNGAIPALAVDASNNIYFGGNSNFRTQKIDATTGLISTIYGTGAGGTGVNQQYNDSTGTFDQNGLFVWPDNSGGVVRRLNADGSVTILAGTLGNPGLTTGPSTAATIKFRPGTVAISPAGLLYVYDTNGYVWKFDAGGNATIIGGNGITTTYTGDGGLATNATFSANIAMNVDKAGNVYLMDKDHATVRVIDTAGYISSIVGTGGAGFTPDGTLAAGAIINNPSGMTMDSDGNVYFADTSNGLIRKIDATTGKLVIIAGNGVTGYLPNSTAAATPMVPRTLTISGSDLYYFDSVSHRVFKIPGVVPTATNSLATTAFSVVPTATGHIGTQERLTVTPSSTVTASKLTFVLPAGATGTSLTVGSKYGITGAVTSLASSNNLTVSFPSQTLVAGVPIAFSITGWTSTGTAGAQSVLTTLYDSTGTTAVGWTRSNIVNQQTGGLPLSSDPGFGSVWSRSLVSTTSAAPTFAVNPSGTADNNTAYTLTNTGVLNNNALAFGGTSLTGNGKTIASTTANSTTSVASASFATNTWGLQIVGSSAANAGATGSGLYSGLSTTPANVLTSSGAANVTTVTARTKVNYLTPAGTYTSALTWALTPGY